MRKKKLTLDEYQQIFDLYEEGYSFLKIITKLNLSISESSLSLNYKRYLENGIESLQAKKRNPSYTLEFKNNVVNEYIKNGKSYSTLVAENNIPSHETVRRWIIKHTEGKENKSYFPKPEVYNMKARKTKLDERIEIVKFCIKNNLDYKSTAERYNVKYSQVYSWVKNIESLANTG